MKKLKELLKKWWAVIVVTAAMAIVLVTRLLKNHPTGTVAPVGGLAKAYRDEVVRVNLEAEIEKERVRATADAERAEIDRIDELGKTDPVEARRKLAEFVARTL